MTAKVLTVPDKIQKAVGEEATKELVDLINQVAAAVSSTKVDKAQYDAHAALIEEKFRRYEELLSEKFARHDGAEFRASRSCLGHDYHAEVDCRQSKRSGVSPPDCVSQCHA